MRYFSRYFSHFFHFISLLRFSIINDNVSLSPVCVVHVCMCVYGYSSIPSGVCQCKCSFLFWIHQFSRGVGYSKVVAILKHESFLNKIKLIFLKIPLFQATCHSPPPKSQRVDELHLGNLWMLVALTGAKRNVVTQLS